MKATKIVCTLGPASSDPQIMKEMLLAGMNVARLNFSHGSHPEHKEKIDTFRGVCGELGIPAAVLLDTKGPEIRLGTFEQKQVLLQKGQLFTLYCAEDRTGTEEGVSISYKGLASQVSSGDRILVDDGRIRMTVEEVRDGNIICRVRDTGNVSTKKGVNVPDIHLEMDYLSEQDKADLLFGIKENVDFVAASFIRSAEDVELVRGFLDSNGGENIKIISKIENPEGILHFEEILKLSDGIMIARGDMGVEVDYATLPGIQKRFIELCNRSGKPVITATQMLESMVHEQSPTRAEITDVANAVFDGTSAVMLSGESASGSYPVRTVQVMSRIVERAEMDMLSSGSRKSMKELYEKSHAPGESDLSTAIGHAACTIADDIGAKALIAITQSGYTARMMSRFHPQQPVIAATPSAEASREMALFRGVIPVRTTQAETYDELLDEAVIGAEKLGFLSSGDRVVISAGLPLHISGNTNMIQVKTI